MEIQAEKTPWNPSKRATARVKNPLPAPEKCHLCDGEVEIVNNRAIYGRSYGEWPYAYLCKCCRSYVGMHPFTNIPLGTLADLETRNARKAAKEEFQRLWTGSEAPMTRSEAYAWMANKLGIPTEECHVGWADVKMCERILEICIARRERLFQKFLRKIWR